MNQTVQLHFLNGEGDDDGDGAKGGRSPLRLVAAVTDLSTRRSVERLLKKLDFAYEGKWAEETGGVHRLRATIQDADQAEAIRLRDGLVAIWQSATPKPGHPDGYPATLR